ncbi:NAD-binding protein [Crucibulum laeve]|uniref:NAD-binding protein n=1 Tax=Crucibulum laeve TaxID=68775 RepID=A0A5C3LEL3_9AGAR|nr:NAD-binding protein [Crucibulum laeve]
MSTTTSKAAIVTGAAQGIGRAIAIRLAEDGYSVAVSDLQGQTSLMEEVVSSIRSNGGNAISVVADVTQEADVDNLVQKAVSEFGGLDVMVANAGIAVLTPILETTIEEWERVFAVNVKGTLLCYKAAAREMIKNPEKGGRIIGACSLAGKKSTALCSTYGSSKFAVRCLTQSAAAEWGRFNITVNGYAPGLIDTPMFTSMNSRIGQLTGQGEAFMETVKFFNSALQRIGTPEDIARLVSFLASKEAAFITGQTISVDGGIWFD